MLPPPQRILPVLQKLKTAYKLWHEYHQTLPKIHRHTIGQRVDNLLIGVIESVVAASFLKREEKQPYVQAAIRRTDTLKILLMILWETSSLDDKKYIALSEKVDEIGRMLGGWTGQLSKKSPQRLWREK